MQPPSQRRQNMLSGAVALLLLVSAVTIGVKASFGAFDGGYALTGSFEAAGQGLLPGSDVKIRGVNVGAVKRIVLHEGRALITLRINDGQKVPRDTTARIRAKTLFGEKYVDLDLTGTDETEGPFLAAGEDLQHTEGGFELEAVLSDLEPLLNPEKGGIDGEELLIVLHNLAEGGRGLGDEINRTFVNGAKVSEVFADNADKTSQFLHDFALLSDELADSAEDLVGIADAGNDALPVLNDHEAELISILQQTGRLSNDVADLLLNNTPFVDAALGDGSKALQVLYDRRTQVVPLVIGLRQYVQTLTEVIRIQVGDGSLMGAVKGLLGTELCGILPCTAAPASAATTTSGVAAPATPSSAPTAPSAPVSGDASQNDLGDLLRRVLGA